MLHLMTWIETKCSFPLVQRESTSYDYEGKRFWKQTQPNTSTYQWRIQDFPQGGANFLSGCANLFFAENCMKMKEFGPPGEACVPGAHFTPLYLPMLIKPCQNQQRKCH